MVFAYPERALAERRIDRLEGVHVIRRQTLVEGGSDPHPIPPSTAANGGRTILHKKAFQQPA
jgi:hypothetical protein